MSEDRYRSVVDNSPFGIYRVTYDGRFITVNPALCAMTGYTADELFAAGIVSLYVDPSDRQAWLDKARDRPQGTAVEVAWRRKDGQVITVRIWIYVDRDSAGDISYLDGYVEDVTPVRATEQALRQAEKLAALGQLVSGVAHELNNPLAAILLFTEDLLSNERAAEEHEALTIIAQQARRSRAIVRDLLSFVRSRDVVRTPVALETLLGDLARTLHPQVGQLAVALHVEIPHSEEMVIIDRAGVEQVITNLVINGAQAAGPNGHVWLRIPSERDTFVIEVVDDGPGIADDILPRIFEPFFTTKPMGQGTGLGLSVSLGIAQQHGGTIIAMNRDSLEGRGARFTLRLPRTATAGTPVSAAGGFSEQPVDSSHKRVLIVDDEETIRRALTRFYARRGWVVTEAVDGGSALERLVRGGDEFDLIISDLKMPGVSGIELHATLGAARPDLLDRVLFCTGEMESPAVAAFIAQTNCRVLRKPFDLRTLAALSDEIVTPIVASR